MARTRSSPTTVREGPRHRAGDSHPPRPCACPSDSRSRAAAVARPPPRWTRPAPRPRFHSPPGRRAAPRRGRPRPAPAPGGGPQRESLGARRRRCRSAPPAPPPPPPAPPPGRRHQRPSRMARHGWTGPCRARRTGSPCDRPRARGTAARRSPGARRSCRPPARAGPLPGPPSGSLRRQVASAGARSGTSRIASPVRIVPPPTMSARMPPLRARPLRTPGCVSFCRWLHDGLSSMPTHSTSPT